MQGREAIRRAWACVAVCLFSLMVLIDAGSVCGVESDDNWTGKCKDGLPDGNGVYTAANGVRYEGSMKAGQREGQGKQVWPNDEVYNGKWKGDQRHGKGKHVWPTGTFYEGEYEGNKRSGLGKIVWGDNHYYEGGWLDDERSGVGVFQWPDGEIYNGSFNEGVRSGNGTNRWPDGERYDGMYKNDMREGTGRHVTSEGEYMGTFLVRVPRAVPFCAPVRTLRSCQHCNPFTAAQASLPVVPGPHRPLTPPLAWSPSAEQKADKKHGIGGFIGLDDTAYWGAWWEDMMHGRGLWKSKGEVYDGWFRRGKKHGTGTSEYSDGSIYEGERVDGVITGHGIFKNEHVQYEGAFLNGRFHGKGRAKFLNEGDVQWYTGEFMDGVRHGVGVNVWTDGRRYDGEWKKGTMHGYGEMRFVDDECKAMGKDMMKEFRGMFMDGAQRRPPPLTEFLERDEPTNECEEIPYEWRCDMDHHPTIEEEFDDEEAGEEVTGEVKKHWWYPIDSETIPDMDDNEDGNCEKEEFISELMPEPEDTPGRETYNFLLGMEWLDDED